MTKNWQVRLDETYDALEAVERSNDVLGDGSIRQALETAVLNLLPAERQDLSNRMAQGDYNSSFYERGPRREEKLSRARRRALILIYTVRAAAPNLVVWLNRVGAAVTAVSHFPDADLVNRLVLELKDPVLQGLRLGKYQMQLLQPHFTGWHATKYRNPALLAGCAIGQRGAGGPGTLGCFVIDNAGVIYILSNHHVLRQVLTGDNEIIQPAHEIGGTYSDVVATFTAGALQYDAAIARVSTGISVENRTWGAQAYAIAGTANWAQNMAVKKHGCATGYRRGTITSNAAGTLLRWEANMQNTLTTDQIAIARDAVADPAANLGFQVPGDSGTILCDLGGQVVALLSIARDNGTAGATDITPILAHFNVAILGVGVHVAP